MSKKTYGRIMRIVTAFAAISLATAIGNSFSRSAGYSYLNLGGMIAAVLAFYFIARTDVNHLMFAGIAKLALVWLIVSLFFPDPQGTLVTHLLANGFFVMVSFAFWAVRAILLTALNIV